MGNMMGTFWKELKKAPLSAKLGIFIILANAFVAIFAPVISPYGETEIVGSEFEPWSLQFLLGTDNLGRDMFTRMNYGARNTIGIAVLTTILAFTLGSLMGLLASTLGGWVDQLISRIVDVILAIPTLIFALLVLTITASNGAFRPSS